MRGSIVVPSIMIEIHVLHDDGFILLATTNKWVKGIAWTGQFFLLLGFLFKLLFYQIAHKPAHGSKRRMPQTVFTFTF